MSNGAALKECYDLLEALDECQKQGLMAKLGGACYDLEKAVRMCRHAAREEDRKAHVLAAREERKRVEENWRRRRQEEDELINK